MASIPAAKSRIFGNNFKRFYLEKGKLFQDFLFDFLNVDKI